MNELKRRSMVEQFESIILDYEQRQLSEIDVELNYEDLQFISECLQFAQLKTEKLEREENKPLTIEGLRGMVGEPVWVERINAKGASRWFVLTAVDENDNTLVGDSDCFIFGEPYLKFYKHKPKGENQ